MEIGNTVRLVQPVVQGVILDTVYEKADKSLIHLVELSTVEGESCARWFKESELEVVNA